MKASSRRGRVLSVAVAGFLTACATTIGTQFARPPADFVRLGDTTGAQVVERFGKPQGEKRHRSDGELLRTIAYYFGSETEPAKDPGTVCFRRLVFVLSDDTVIRETFQSSCVADHTDFDERKAGEIVKGKTRCEDAVAILGRPNSRAIDPATGKKGQLGIGYMYTNFARSVDAAKPYSKDLELLCDPEGIVREMSFREFGSR